MINVNDFPYGRITKRLAKVVEYLNTHGPKPESAEYFDFPDYGGLPKKLTDRLSGDEVDFIQDQWGNL